MQENHQRQQYWFDFPTLRRLSELVQQYDHPVALCCPMVGQFMANNGETPPLVLDLDGRFEADWFRLWDLHKPAPLEFKPDLVVVDPPFSNIKLDRLWKAMRVLMQGDFTTPLVMVWPTYNEGALLGTFSAYGLQPTGLVPGYVSCDPCAQLYANFDLRAVLVIGEDETI